MLDKSKQDYLYQIIAASIGEDVTIKQYKSYFTDSTVTVVEKMISENKKCNSTMQLLFEQLLGGAGALSSGWLKKVLNASKKSLSATELDGYGCRVVSKSKWKTAILNSTI